MNYYLQEQFSDMKLNASALGKARTDICSICDNLGYSPVELRVDFVPKDEDGFIKKYRQHCQISKQWHMLLKKMQAGDYLIVQYPLMFNSIFLGKELDYCKKRGIRVVCLVHDLDILRMGKAKTIALRKRIKIHLQELRQLKKYCGLIVHNEKMLQFLIQQKFDKQRIVSLNLFDYLVREDKQCIETTSQAICVAGNLSPKKAGYVYKLWQLPLVFNLYGGAYKDSGQTQEDNQRNVYYQGVFESEQLVNELDGRYGLVWDGDDLTTCSGIYGNYERYNNPHKASLYLAAGLPLIVWSKAAIATFVKEKKIGIVIDSLHELPKCLDEISVSEYEQLRKNAGQLGHALRQGQFTKTALEKVHEIS
ncbi:MAG: hypothetical protein IJZ44_07110 [Lachnospiraceae bacterium]|nr:hypothetical protein [Lachnospiraceae bacterium]